jgi:hypothetical protein
MINGKKLNFDVCKLSLFGAVWAFDAACDVTECVTHMCPIFIKKVRIL